jgi:hypothetical protein
MMPAIEISNDLYRALQSLAIPFEDKTPADVIARLIRERPQNVEGAPSPQPPVATGGLAVGGTVLPNGLRLRFNYQGKLVAAEVREDRIWIGDKAYTSPSSAATAAADQLGYPGRSLNGWWYWEYEDDGERWHQIRRLQRTRKARKRRR